MTEPARKRKRRLGKGLESLLSKTVIVAPPEPSPSTIAERDAIPLVDLPKTESVQSEKSGAARTVEEGGLVYLATSSISPNPRQPRQRFEEQGLVSLADSLKSAGMVQPVVVRRCSKGGTYELVAGERRWRAAMLAGLLHIPALIRDLDDQASAQWALIENLQREDLNPMDRAEAFDRMIIEFKLTQQDIATQLGIDRSSVANFIRLNDLEPSVKECVRNGQLSMGHAKVLLGVPDHTSSKALAKKCSSEQWSVRELERQIKKLSSRRAATKAKEMTAQEMYLEQLSSQLGDHLGTKVRITTGSKKGSGSLIIAFYTIEQFDGVLDRLDFKPKT